MAKISNSEEAQRQQHIRQQAAFEMEWRAKVFYALRRQKAPFLKVAREDGLIIAWSRIEELISREPLEKVLRRLYADVVPTTAETFYRSNVNQKRFSFSFDWLVDMTRWLTTFAGDMITDMTNYTKKNIVQIISNGINDGDGYDQIIDRINSTGLDRVRAAAIARTETNRGMGWAKYEAIGKLPYPANVVWIASRDNRTRGYDGKGKADHFHMNGNIVPYGQPFTDPRNGDQLNFPGDVSLGAGPASVCNCRCSIASRRRRQ